MLGYLRIDGLPKIQLNPLGAMPLCNIFILEVTVQMLQAQGDWVSVCAVGILMPLSSESEAYFPYFVK